LSRNARSHYVAADEHFVTCPNQDVVYGTGYFALDKEPIVFQVPEFGDRFWVYALYDARTDEFSQIGKPYGTRVRLSRSCAELAGREYPACSSTFEESRVTSAGNRAFERRGKVEAPGVERGSGDVAGECRSE
jgi:hypothetical protein